MRRTLFALFALASMGAVAAPTSAQTTAQKWRKLETRTWKVEVPAEWTLYERSVFGEDKHRVRWIYVSPRGNYRLRVNVEKDRGVPFAKLADERWGEFLASARDVRIHKNEKLAVDGRQVHLAIAQAVLRVRDKDQEYVAFRLLSTSADKKLLIGVALDGRGEQLSVFDALVDRVMSTFEIKAGAHTTLGETAPAAAPKGRR
jgi:hypothetical protein